jgi:hypothetical protein
VIHPYRDEDISQVDCGHFAAEVPNIARPYRMPATTDQLALQAIPPPAATSHPGRDRIFACLFVLMVSLPGLALISTGDRTTTQFENRAAAPWPTWSPALSLREYSASFERAFGDRFGGRDALVRLHHSVLVEAFHTSPVPEVVLGYDDWLFLTPGYKDFSVDAESVVRMPRRRDYASIVAGIGRRINYLHAAGIDYLLVVVPDKQTIYMEHYPTHMREQQKDSLLDAVLAHLPSEWRSHVLDLRAPLRAAKAERQVYWRTDTHWNYTGGWVGYQAILAVLKHAAGAPAALSTMPHIMPWGDTSGDLAYMIGLPARFTEPSFALGRESLAWLCASTLTGEIPSWDPVSQTIYCPSAGLGSVAIYHDSAILVVRPWLSREFLVSRWVRGREWNLDLLAADKPEVLIDEIVERNLPALADTSFLQRRAASKDAAPEPDK